VIFLIDENLSPKLAAIAIDELQLLHINDLKPHQGAIIKDDLIRKLSLDHPFVLVTKDDDFVKSWVSRKVPERMIYVYDDFSDARSLLEGWKEALPEFIRTLHKVDFIEFSCKGIRTPFDIPIQYQFNK
jgi:predicted nuclease of predicted toxin-antitoxin system